jgi:hypothetical protein
MTGIAGNHGADFRGGIHRPGGAAIRTEEIEVAVELLALGAVFRDLGRVVLVPVGEGVRRHIRVPGLGPLGGDASRPIPGRQRIDNTQIIKPVSAIKTSPSARIEDHFIGIASLRKKTTVAKSARSLKKPLRLSPRA